MLMSKFKCLVAVVGLLVTAQLSFADDREKVIGIWKLVSQEIEVQATGQKEPVMGHSPTGYAIFTAEGRVMFVLAGEGRKPPQTSKIPPIWAMFSDEIGGELCCADRCLGGTGPRYADCNQETFCSAFQGVAHCSLTIPVYRTGDATT